jgi:hypothetical protein
VYVCTCRSFLMLCPTRKIDISQYPKFLGFPAEHGGGSADDDHSEHDVWPEQPFECDADIVYQYINGRHVYFLSDLARIHRVLMIGPPSQSLGVDPVDPAIMRKPPRKKDESIITRRLLYRVLFSASIIVIGTLCVYIFALSDDHVSRREQTMVKSSFPPLATATCTDSCADFHIFRVLGPRVGHPKPGSWVRVDAEQDADINGISLFSRAACARIRAVHAGGIQDGSP